MPRTIEHIVHTHKLARELADAGQPVWKGTIPIKGLLAEDRSNTSEKHLADLSNRVARVIKMSVPKKYFDVTSDVFDFDFDDVLSAMESCTEKALKQDTAAGHPALEVFNGWLTVVYDWADNNRFWVT